jgi:hypothetical protein
MESLLLFRRALSSPTMCRFIPALSVPNLPQSKFQDLDAILKADIAKWNDSRIQ